MYPSMFDVGCFSYTLDQVGDHFHTPTIKEFGTAWISLFSHSHKTRMIWREHTGEPMASYSATQWWSRWEVYQQLMVQFGDLEAIASEG